MVATFCNFIVRNPGKKHAVDLEILSRMLFFRVSDDKITKSYGQCRQVDSCPKQTLSKLGLMMVLSICNISDINFLRIFRKLTCPR